MFLPAILIPAYVCRATSKSASSTRWLWRFWTIVREICLLTYPLIHPSIPPSSINHTPECLSISSFTYSLIHFPLIIHPSIHQHINSSLLLSISSSLHPSTTTVIAIPHSSIHLSIYLTHWGTVTQMALVRHSGEETKMNILSVTLQERLGSHLQGLLISRYQQCRCWPIVLAVCTSALGEGFRL